MSLSQKKDFLVAHRSHAGEKLGAKCHLSFKDDILGNFSSMYLSEINKLVTYIFSEQNWYLLFEHWTKSG